MWSGMEVLAHTIANDGKMKMTLALYDIQIGQHNGITADRSALIILLNASDIITFAASAVTCDLYNIEDGLTNAQGFLYSPFGGSVAAVAWSVSAIVYQRLHVGSFETVPHTIVHVNLQSVWNPTTHKVTIPLAGSYFIDLTANLCGSGSCDDKNSGTHLDLGLL